MGLTNRSLRLGYICARCLREQRLSAATSFSDLISYNNDIRTFSTGRLKVKSEESDAITSTIGKFVVGKRSYHHSRRSNDQVLQKAYNDALVHLIKENLDPIQEFLEKNTIQHSDGVSLWRSSTHELDMLQSLVDDSFSVTQIIKQLGVILNSNYHTISTERKQIPRYNASLSEYNWFLTLLYPKNGKINYSKLYDAYNTLPSPRPSHISPNHLEDLLSAFMAPTHNTEATRAIFFHILDDVEEAGMPISHHEINAAITMALKGYQEDIEQLSKMDHLNNRASNPSSMTPLSDILYGSQQANLESTNYLSPPQSSFGSTVPTSPSLEQLKKFHDKINGSHQRDISSINTLYMHALKTNDVTLASKTSYSLREGEVMPDRITFLIEIIQAGISRDAKKVRDLYREMTSRKLTIDITVMNVMMKALLQSSDIQSAEAIFEMLLTREDKRLEKLEQDHDQNDDLEESFEYNFHAEQDISIPRNKNIRDTSESIGPKVPLQATLMNQLRLIDFVQQIINQPTIPEQSEPILKKPPTGIQGDIPLIPSAYTFGNFFAYNCLKSEDAEKVYRLINLMKKYNIPFNELFFRLLFRGFIGNASKTSDWGDNELGSDETSSSKRVNWDKSFLHYITQLLFDQHYELSQLSLIPGGVLQAGAGSTGSLENVANNPFTTRVCAYMLKAYETVYWDNKMAVIQIRDEYKRAIQPATSKWQFETAESATGNESTNALDSPDSPQPEKTKISVNKRTIEAISSQTSISSIVYQTTHHLLSLH